MGAEQTHLDFRAVSIEDNPEIRREHWEGAKARIRDVRGDILLQTGSRGGFEKWQTTLHAVGGAHLHSSPSISSALGTDDEAPRDVDDLNTTNADIPKVRIVSVLC